MKTSTIITFLIVTALVSCEEKKNPVEPKVIPFPCMEYLDSSTFEAKFYSGRYTVLSLNPRRSIESVGTLLPKKYVELTFSNDGKTVIKTAGEITYPERNFKIENKNFYYGDEHWKIISCDSNSFSLESFESYYLGKDTLVEFDYSFNKKK